MNGHEESEGQHGEGTAFHSDLVEQGVHVAANLATGRPDQAFAQLARMLQEQGRLPADIDPTRIAQSVMGMVSRGDVVPPPVDRHPGHGDNGAARPTPGGVRRASRDRQAPPPASEPPADNAAHALNQIGLRIAQVVENEFVKKFGVRENGLQIQLEITYKSGTVPHGARDSETYGPMFTAEAFLVDPDGEERELSSEDDEVLTAGPEYLGDLVNMLLQDSHKVIEQMANEGGDGGESDPPPSAGRGAPRRG